MQANPIFAVFPNHWPWWVVKACPAKKIPNTSLFSALTTITGDIDIRPTARMFLKAKSFGPMEKLIAPFPTSEKTDAFLNCFPFKFTLRMEITLTAI